MKTALRRGILLATGLIALLPASAFGQTAYLRVNIPFDFRAGDSALPAGEYRVNLDAQAQRLTLRQADGTAAVFVQARPRQVKAADAGSAVFYQYGDTYILRNVQSGGSAWAYETPRTKVERELASQNAYPKVATVSAR